LKLSRDGQWLLWESGIFYLRPPSVGSHQFPSHCNQLNLY